jgi:hypothetical protein
MSGAPGELRAVHGCQLRFACRTYRACQALGKVEYYSKRIAYPNTCSQRCSASDNPRPRFRT